MFGWLAKKVVGAVSAIGRGIKSMFGSGEEAARKVAEQEAYERERASAEQAAKINRLLADYKNDALRVAVGLEIELANVIRDTFDSMRERLDVFEDSCEVLDLHPLRKRWQDMSKDAGKVNGILQQDIIPKISLDNEKCCEILRMPAGPDKRKEMNTFIVDSVVWALNAQKRQLTHKIEVLDKELKRRVEECVKSTFGSMKEAARLRQAGLMDDKEKGEVLLVGASRKICLANHATNLFGMFESGRAAVCPVKKGDKKAR